MDQVKGFAQSQNIQSHQPVKVSNPRIKKTKDNPNGTALLL